MEYTFIKDLKVGIKNLNLAFIVIEIGRATTTKEGHEIRTCRVADRTGTIHLSVWGELGAYIQTGDICRITKAYVSLWKCTPTLYVGKSGELIKTGEFCFIFNETLNMSDTAQQQQANTSSIKSETENPPPISMTD